MKRNKTRAAGVVAIAVLAGFWASHAAAKPADDIIVTGERIDRSLGETTSSVVVVTQADATARGLSRFADVVERASNVAPVYGAGGFSIRGISNIGVSNAGEAPTANIYLDDIPLAPTFLHAAPTDLWDIRQLEIWRGPQGTLRGQNALAGAVIIETTDPSLDRREALGRAVLSDEVERQIGIAAGAPLIAGELAARVAGSFSRRDGFIRNLTHGGSEDEETRSTVRAKLLWQPAALPGLVFKLGYSHFRRRGGYFTSYARTDRPDYFDNRVALDNTPNHTDLDFDGLSAQVLYPLGPQVTLVGATTWSKARETSSFDGDYGPENLAYSEQRRLYDTLTQELRLAFTGGALTGVAGLYYFDRTLASHTHSRTEVPTPVPTIAGLLGASGFSSAQASAVAGIYGAALPAISVDFDGSFPTKVRTAAAFADLRLRLTERLSLLTGLRLDHFAGSNGAIQEARFAGQYPAPAGFGSLAPVIAAINTAVGGFVAQANGNVAGAERNTTTLLPKAGLLMTWNKDTSISFVAQRAYRPGGVSVNLARGLTVPYAAEYAWNFELALRSSLAGGRLRFGANAYLMRWREQQVTVNFGLNAFDTNTVNAGASRLFGVETEAGFQVCPSWALRASAGYAHTRFDRFNVAQLGIVSDLSGTEFAFAPRWTLTLGSDVHLPNGIAGSLSLSHRSKAYGAVGARQAAYAVSASTLVDARLGYESARWSAFVSIRNLLSDNAILYKSPAESRAVLSAPRTVAVELAAHY